MKLRILRGSSSVYLPLNFESMPILLQINKGK